MMARTTKKTDERPSCRRTARLFKVIGRTAVTLTFIACSALAIHIGASELGRRAEAAAEPAAASIVPVSTSPVTLETEYTVRRTFIGQVEAQKTTSLSFELPGRLDNLTVDEGDHVEKGDILAQQDISLLVTEQSQLTASRKATEAQLRFADQTVRRNSNLTERGFTSQAGLDEALARQSELQARIAEIDAGLDSVAIRMSKSQLKAPFDGQITERLVDGGETLGAGQRVLGLVELRKPQVRIGVPLDVTDADLSNSRIEIAGVARDATLVTLRPDVDPITRTRTAIFEMETFENAAFGQTARLVFSDRIAANGFWAPITSLKEGVRGQWTLLVVDPEAVVRSASVEILHAESERVYVRGAFSEDMQLVNEGPHRVTVGQRVTTEPAQ